VFDPKFLEFGISNFLLVGIIVYILKWHIPNLVKSFQDGMASIAKALKEVNTRQQEAVDAVEELKDDLKETMRAEISECNKRCMHEREVGCSETREDRRASYERVLDGLHVIKGYLERK